jgi:hypothetical protein
MKKTFYLIGLFISLAAITKAQGYKYELVREYFKDHGYAIGQEWNCPLKEGEYFTKTFKFESGITYDIVALSEDNDVLDVDMQLFEDGELYTGDTKSSAYAEVAFTPQEDRTLTIKTKNYSSKTPYYASKVYFMIAYKY